jgi:lactoylglutathione lyase
VKFLQVTIFVGNLEESISFYENIVGLTVKRRLPAAPDQEIAFLGEGETEIELIYNKKKEEISVGQDISLGFETASVDELIVQLREKGVPLISDIIQPNPQVKFFFVTDPNGVKIQFEEKH